MKWGLSQQASPAWHNRDACSIACILGVLSATKTREMIAQQSC